MKFNSWVVGINPYKEPGEPTAILVLILIITQSIV